MSNVVPFKWAQNAVAIESAIPDELQREQAMHDVEAFYEDLVEPGKDSATWTKDHLFVLAEMLVEQSGEAQGALRFLNVLRVLRILREPDPASGEG
jgi:hypothetical protein